MLDRLTVTPLLYACGALLLLSLSLAGALKWEAGKVSTADAKRDAAIADRDAVATERDAWKRRVDELAAANGAYGDALGFVRTALSQCQTENTRIADAGARAVAVARAEAADADRTLQHFTAKFQTESRKPNCASALSAMAAACPALEGY